LSFVAQNCPELKVSGGQRESKLTPEQYASIIRRSKIGINFSLSPTMMFHQLKGRTFEYIMSYSLLLESKNPSIEDFFVPGEHYVEFESQQDLLDKIKYYLENEKERLKIVENGYNHFRNNYTAEIYWNKVMEAVDKFKK
jgi:spore maturation protein CgeB